MAETGTAWVTCLVQPAAGHSIHLARIAGVEVISAIVRRVRGGALSPPDATVALGQFRGEFAGLYRIVEPTPGLITMAMTLVETHALRGYDAVQLAVALQVNRRCLAMGFSLRLVSADAELTAAAAAEGLAVEDPNAHP